MGALHVSNVECSPTSVASPSGCPSFAWTPHPPTPVKGEKHLPALEKPARPPDPAPRGCSASEQPYALGPSRCFLLLP